MKQRLINNRNRAIEYYNSAYNNQQYCKMDFYKKLIKSIEHELLYEYDYCVKMQFFDDEEYITVK